MERANKLALKADKTLVSRKASPDVNIHPGLDGISFCFHDQLGMPLKTVPTWSLWVRHDYLACGFSFFHFILHLVLFIILHFI